MTPFYVVSGMTGETLADIKPRSSQVIVGEGLIEIEGGVWQTGVYMADAGPQIMKAYRNVRNKPVWVQMYKGIEIDGWYGIENIEVHKNNFQKGEHAGSPPKNL